MRKRFFCFVVLALVGLAATWRWAFPDHEPHHKGKPVSSWVDRACEHGWDYRQQIIEIGPLVVPYLVKKLTMQDDPFRDAVNNLHHHLPEWLQQRAPYVSSSAMVRWRAAWALSWLGSNAAPAAASLAKEISDPNRAEFTMAVALVAIGAEAKCAVPALHIALTFTNQTPDFRTGVARAIWSIAKDTNLVLNVCTNAITTGRADVPATWILSDMGPAAMDTAPLLLQVLQDTNRSERLRSTAAWALGSMRLGAPDIIDALVANTGNELPLIRIYSAAALWKMAGKCPSNAVPVIVEGILDLGQSDYGEGKESFVQFVEGCQLDVTGSVPFLNDLLRDRSPLISQAASNALETIRAQSAAGTPSK